VLDFTLEAPCATWRECVALRRRTDVPILWDELATDEASIAQLIADDPAEGIGRRSRRTAGDARPAPARHVRPRPERFLRCVLESRDMVSVTLDIRPSDSETQ
jgi:hypothetical protein